MGKYEVGSIITGNVTGIESYGAFVNLDDYYSGLIHISEMSHGFVKDINDYVKVGESIKAKVLDVDEDLFQLKLSIKDVKQAEPKRNRKNIEEVGSGFTILENHLGQWIADKKEQLVEKQ